MKTFIISLISAGIFAGMLSAAQEAKEPTVAVRQENQQKRIAQGVKSGQLTAGETAKLEKKEVAINKEVKADRAANGGKLTAAEKKTVNAQQNTVSRKIYKAKHNSAVAQK